MNEAKKLKLTIIGLVTYICIDKGAQLWSSHEQRRLRDLEAYQKCQELPDVCESLYPDAAEKVKEARAAAQAKQNAKAASTP